jgi:hypothetical protein
MKPGKKTGSWSERLERIVELVESGAAVDLFEEIGAAARRGVEATEHRTRFGELLERARERGDLDSVSFGELRFDELERRLSGLDEGERGPLEILEHRERLAAVVAGAHLLGLPCGPIERRLEAIDQLGETRVGAFLHLNDTRRAALDQLGPKAGRCWWWRARLDCDREALAGLGIGARADSEDREREALIEHVAACVHCQRELRWLSRLDTLLGPGAEEGHPSTADLLAHAAGEGEASSRQTIAAHLEGCASCRGLLAGARAGLAEAERIEVGLSLQRAPQVETQTDDLWPVHLLPVAMPAQPRALAADPAEEPSPLPSERRVLWERGELRLVFHVVAGRGELGLFGEEQGHADLEVTLDGERLEPAESEPEARVFDLGPLGRLVGRTLAIKLDDWERSWTLIEEKA